jgi:hypothetical protein
MRWTSREVLPLAAASHSAHFVEQGLGGGDAGELAGDGVEDAALTARLGHQRQGLELPRGADAIFCTAHAEIEDAHDVLVEGRVAVVVLDAELEAAQEPAVDEVLVGVSLGRELAEDAVDGLAGGGGRGV